MSLRIATEKLQAMASSAYKGASREKLLVLTNLIQIKFEEGVLELQTNDGANTLILKSTETDGDNFLAVVEVEKFVKLLSKMTFRFYRADSSRKLTKN